MCCSCSACWARRCWRSWAWAAGEAQLAMRHVRVFGKGGQGGLPLPHGGAARRCRPCARGCQHGPHHVVAVARPQPVRSSICLQTCGVVPSPSSRWGWWSHSKCSAGAPCAAVRRRRPPNCAPRAALHRRGGATVSPFPHPGRCPFPPRARGPQRPGLVIALFLLRTVCMSCGWPLVNSVMNDYISKGQCAARPTPHASAPR